MHITDTYEDTFLFSTEALLDEDFDVLDGAHDLVAEPQVPYISQEDFE